MGHNRFRRSSVFSWIYSGLVVTRGNLQNLHTGVFPRAHIYFYRFNLLHKIGGDYIMNLRRKKWTIVQSFLVSFILHCIFSLQLPPMSGSSSILKDTCTLLKLKPIVIFLCFATLAGIFDSFIIYFLFW